MPEGTGAPERRSFTPKFRRVGDDVQLDFPPIENGIDYLRSVVEQLSDDRLESGPRAVKYAVLHLQAAAEVLLKAYLLREHWSLVLADPGKASKKAFDSGNFTSCTMEQAIERLRNIAGVDISDKDAKALKDLASDRNKLQHYGMTHSVQVVEARAAAALDFLVRFVENHLLCGLEITSATAKAALAMDDIRQGMNQIDSFIKRRMNRLRGNELKGKERRTLHCPTCEQPALVVGPPRATCHFCEHTPVLILSLLVGSDWEQDARQCPSCDDRMLFEGLPFIEQPATADFTAYCFSCDSDFTVLVPCQRCQRPVAPPAHDVDAPEPPVLCQDCVGHTFYPDEHEESEA
ncbi:hypothetical protein ACWCQL_10530 [Streptomyces sp. NPDC002073]